MSDDDRVIAEAAQVIRDAMRAHFFEVRAEFAANIEARALIRYGLGDPRELPSLKAQRETLGRELNAAYKALQERP